jgi:signal transduction histidine kinase
MFELDGIEAKHITQRRDTFLRLNQQRESILRNNILIQFCNAISQMLVVLNENRQIVYANKHFIDKLGLFSPNSYLGKRPGEAVNCAHSLQAKGGCGTTEFCRTCGAVNAILESQQGIQSVRECRISTINNDALDLKVTSTPIKFENEEFSIFVIEDISDEKRRQILERIFFHDVLNSAGGIAGLTDLIGIVNNQQELKEIAGMIHTSAKNLISDIEAQRQLSAAELGELKLYIDDTYSFYVLKDVAELYANHEIARNKLISIDKKSEDFLFKTDISLLRRILGNMTKNALEASLPGTIITLKAENKNGNAVFSVQNPGFIEHDAQLQLFNRSFSTKGAGRGLGTYSMKLFGEKYLGGKVWFESTKENGTCFFIMI